MRPILLFHANIFSDCFEHSNFFKVIAQKGRAPLMKGELNFNYELFNCNNFNIRFWSWNYRGCWHQTCPPIVPR